MREPKKTLEKLLEQRVISGYNIFNQPLERKEYTFILSNLHETDAYCQDVENELRILGFPNEKVSLQLRDRVTTFYWKAKYLFKDINGKVYPNIKIRNHGEYIDLERINARSFTEAGFTKESCKDFICDNKAYEIFITCHQKKDLLELASCFREHSYIGNKNAWRDAYRTPAIIIEAHGLSIPGFKEATLFTQMFNDIEASFIMPKNGLKKLDPFTTRKVYANIALIQDILKELRIQKRYKEEGTNKEDGK